MALTAFTRFRFLWGALSIDNSDPVYTAPQQALLGTSAVAGSGIGARRAQLVFTRTPPGTFAEDVAVMHFDFLNLTGGAPDDTWTVGDYTTLETAITTWWTAAKVLCVSGLTFKEIRWYRFGTGIVPPNPPQRVTAVGVAGSSGVTALPPQCSASISFHVGPRRSWGRTYLPSLHSGGLTAGGVMSTTNVDTLANAVNTMVGSAASADFYLGVYSKHLESFLTVEQIAVDNIVDIIRRRRWEHPTYRKALP